MQKCSHKINGIKLIMILEELKNRIKVTTTKNSI